MHVHVAEGRASARATKLWITSAGKVVVCSNESNIPERLLRRIARLIEANSEEIVAAWVEHFGELSYYC